MPLETIRRPPGPSPAVRTGRKARLHSVFERTLHDNRRALTWWSVGMVLLAGYSLAFFPTVSGNTSMRKLVDSYPEALRKLMAIRDFTTGPGYLQAYLFSFMAPILLLMVALLHGSDATSGEEDRGTIDILLSCPISRSRVVLEKFAAITAGLALLAAALLATLLVGGPLVGLDVAVNRVVAVCAASLLLAVDIGALALFVGAATGRRGLARGVSAAVAVASYLVSGLADVASGLRPVRPLSLYYHSLGIQPLFTGFSLLHTAVLVAVAAVLVVLAAVSFERRDLCR